MQELAKKGMNSREYFLQDIRWSCLEVSRWDAAQRVNKQLELIIFKLHAVVAARYCPEVLDADLKDPCPGLAVTKYH